MRNFTTTTLLLSVLVGLAAPAESAGFKRGSYGGGRRVGGNVQRSSSGGSRQAQRQAASGAAQNSGSGSGFAPVRGRGSVGFGSAQTSYNSGAFGSGYVGRGGGFGRGLGVRSFGGGGRYAGSSVRTFGTRYEDNPGGGQTEPAPVQGFAVPGALIRTAGLENYYHEPSQPAREFTVPAGRPQIQDNLAWNETNHRGVYGIQPDRVPPPNPSGGSASGGNGATPNAPITGLGGQTFGSGSSGGDKPNDPSSFNPNQGGGN